MAPASGAPLPPPDGRPPPGPRPGRSARLVPSPARRRELRPQRPPASRGPTPSPVPEGRQRVLRRALRSCRA
eukprot:2685335-Pleurochrysis_carterae.AAC.1